MHSSFSASILKDTNRIVSTSDTQWSNIREGALFRFIDDKIFYQVAKVDKIYLIKDFKVINRMAIDINSYVGINLMVGDEITISYKEWGLQTVWEIACEGEGYRVNDIVNVMGGTPSMNTINGEYGITSFKVKEVSPRGGITQIGIVSKGEYIKAPDSKVEVIGGNGKGGALNVTWDVIDNRKTFQKTIESIEVKPEVAHILLNSPLPKDIEQGKLSVEKSEIYLSNNYIQDSRISSHFEIIKDFTPHYNIPLLAENSFSTERIYNYGMVLIEAKLKAATDKIEELESKLSQLTTVIK